jgi:hypothetical protein
MAFAQPNLWILSGGGITFRYFSTTPTVFYQDAFRTLNLTGASIRSVNVPDLGTLVTITTFLTVDSGSSTFTVLLPVVNLSATPISSAPVSTSGITTAHHFSIFPAFAHGQQEFYAVTPLTGNGFFI